MIVAFTIFIGITIYLVYYNRSLINNICCIKFNNRKKNQKLDEFKYINGNNETDKY